MRSKKLAKKIVDELLDEGMGHSSWREKYPDAYNELLEYRRDMESSVAKVLVKQSETRIRNLLGLPKEGQ